MRSRMRCGLIEWPGWRRSRRRLRRCRWRSLCGSRGRRRSCSWLPMFIPTRSAAGIADQLGLACKISGFAAARRLGMARALWFELPETYRLLVTGEVSEYVASLVVTETRHLDANTRREVDGKICASGVAQMGPRSAAACARKHAYEADREGYVQRGRTEPKNRRVGLRPAPDTMSLLSGYLPAEQGVACLKALQDHTDTTKAAGDPRCRDQIIALWQAARFAECRSSPPK